MRPLNLLTDGWLLHYNFIRPHETLRETPAEAAGIKFPYQNWKEVVSKGQPLTPRQTSSTGSIRIPDVSDLPRYTKAGFKIVRRKSKKAKKKGQKSMTSIATILR